MTADQRRDQIYARISQSVLPVSASTLATEFSVSRQVIVGDIALMRASGREISATPRGYALNRDSAGLIRRVVCNHTAAQMEDELNTIVDNGCCTLNVTVEHPVYGTLTGELKLSSRYDVRLFLEKTRRAEARPLSSLTEGVHIHELMCPDEDAFQRVRQELKNKGFLLES